ncbi:MAG: extracellular solute-binding protein [Pseudoflavonifractor sp.]
MQKKRRSTALLVALLLGLTACAPPGAAAPDDVLTQKVADSRRIPVTVLVKNAFSIRNFEQAAEAAFPQLDLIQVGNFTCDMGIAEYHARMQHDDLTDIVMTWPLNVGEEYWSDRLMDLSALPCSARYNTSRLGEISRDGSLYYLPGPSQIRGIVYNKTMFRENGWTVPEDYEGFLALCQQIEAHGIRSLQLGLGNSEVLDTAFIGYNLASSFSTPSDVQWLADYNAGTGNFADHFTPALDNFQRLIDTGILQPGDLNLTYADRERMLFNRKCAMIEDSVLLARMGKNYNGCTDEFGLMPFFSPGNDGDWARLYPVCYIGVNKHLTEPENKAHCDLVLQLMDYISTPEGQQALMADTGGMYSSLNSVPPPRVPETADMLSALEHGRATVFPVLENAGDALHRGLAGMVAGTLTGAEVAAMVDGENTTAPAPALFLNIGEAAEDFSQIETGNFVTDAMREESGCEIALFLDNGKDGLTNGKGIGAKLYKGPLCSSDLSRILPDLRQNETGTLWKVTMTGADLIRTLEYSIPVDNNHAGWFYYFSGLRMEYAPAAEPGTRIGSITTGDGKGIERERLYSVAVMDESVPQDAIVSCEKTGISIRSILERALSSGPVSPSGDGRFTVILP